MLLVALNHDECCCGLLALLFKLLLLLSLPKGQSAAGEKGEEMGHATAVSRLFSGMNINVKCIYII